MIFIGGQADINGAAEVTCPNDIVQQTTIAMEGIKTVLKGMQADTEDLVKLTAFYVLEDRAIENDILQVMARCLEKSLDNEFGCARPGLSRPGPTVTLVPIETNCFDGLSIEIEAIAMRGQNGEILPRDKLLDSRWHEFTWMFQSGVAL